MADDDYDMEAYNKDNPNAVHVEGQHYPDTYKKPSHITFSKESKYSTPEQEGGEWKKESDGKWHFYASPFNLKQHSAEELQEYFKTQEQDSVLHLPNKEGSMEDDKKIDEASTTGNIDAAFFKKLDEMLKTLRE